MGNIAAGIEQKRLEKATNDYWKEQSKYDEYLRKQKWLKEQQYLIKKHNEARKRHKYSV